MICQPVSVGPSITCAMDSLYAQRVVPYRTSHALYIVVLLYCNRQRSNNIPRLRPHNRALALITCYPAINADPEL